MPEEDLAGSLGREHTPEAIRIRLNAQRNPSLVRDAILGATDGCVTTFSVVAGAVGGGLPVKVVVILGFANLLADGFSMAASNYLGAKSLNDELEQARLDELKHIREIPEGEKEEVRQIFASKGFQGDLLDKIVSVIVGNRHVWVETMITEELGLRPMDSKPVRAACATFASFCAAGMVPLLAFLAPGFAAQERFLMSCVATAATFFLVGCLKGRALARPAWKSGLETLLLGGTAATLAYAAGFGLSSLGSP